MGLSGFLWDPMSPLAAHVRRAGGHGPLGCVWAELFVYDPVLFVCPLETLCSGCGLCGGKGHWGGGSVAKAGLASAGAGPVPVLQESLRLLGFGGVKPSVLRLGFCFISPVRSQVTFQPANSLTPHRP